MDRLDELEAQSIYIIREARHHFRRLALLWSIGKDSTTLVWLCRKAFFGQLPFSVLHIDTGYKFGEIYQFRDKYAALWKLDLIVARNSEAVARGRGPSGGKFECCTSLKTEALKQAVAARRLEGLLLGIRRDEHGIRAKERHVSPRDRNFNWSYGDQPPELWDHYRSNVSAETHVRIHPLLHWTEKDVWRYIRRENIPFVRLYLAVDGRRYRSIGCEPCCSPVASRAVAVEDIIAELEVSRIGEREGRAQDKESAYTMQKLRALGYM